jgi:hypothetical protein
MNGGAKKSRGRPRGTGKAFYTDPDRHVIGMIDGLMLTNSGIKFEHAAMMSIYFHRQERITLPVNPLRSARRLNLRARVQRQLRQGWQLQQWGPKSWLNRDTIGNQVDRIRKKRARFARDPAAARWRYFMALAWASLLRAPNIGLIEAAAREAGELTYLETTMLPFVESLIPAAAI